MQRVLILKADLVCGEALRATAERVFPQAAVLLVSRIDRAQAILEAITVDLLITGLDLPDGDALDFIFAAVTALRRATRVLVVSQHHEQFVLETLDRWHVDVFDPASEDQRGLEQALRTLAAGQSYWAPGLRARLERNQRRGQALHRILSVAEQAILSGIGDGSDDQTTADRLNRTASNIHDQRKKLHRKLGLHYRGALVQYAVNHGFVRFTRGRVVRPGFQQLLAAYTARSAGYKRGPKTRSNAAAAA